MVRDEELFSKRELYPDYETWLQGGKEAAKKVEGVTGNRKDVEKQLAAWRWAIGDWLVDGEKLFPKRVSYAEVGKVTGLNSDDLYQCRYVAKRFTPEDRHKSLSWNHHKEVAQVKGDLRQEWLALAAREGLSVSGLRGAIDRQKKSGYGKNVPSHVKDTAPTQERPKQYTVKLQFDEPWFRLLVKLAGGTWHGYYDGPTPKSSERISALEPDDRRPAVERYVKSLLLGHIKSITSMKDIPSVKRLLAEVEADIEERKKEEYRNQNKALAFDEKE
jgi:hypothetical protein